MEEALPKENPALGLLAGVVLPAEAPKPPNAEGAGAALEGVEEEGEGVPKLNPEEEAGLEGVVLELEEGAPNAVGFEADEEEGAKLKPPDAAGAGAGEGESSPDAALEAGLLGAAEPAPKLKLCVFGAPAAAAPAPATPPAPGEAALRFASMPLRCSAYIRAAAWSTGSRSANSSAEMTRSKDVRREWFSPRSDL